MGLRERGPAWLLGDLDECWDDESERARILDAVRAVEHESISMLGVSAHLLAIGRHRAP